MLAKACLHYKCHLFLNLQKTSNALAAIGPRKVYE